VRRKIPIPTGTQTFDHPAHSPEEVCVITNYESTGNQS